MDNTTRPMPAIVIQDPLLEPYAHHIQRRLDQVNFRIREFTTDGKAFKDMALGHLYYGLHKEPERWVFREWAPNATEIYLIGEFSDWGILDTFKFRRINGVNWELEVPLGILRHKDLYRIFIRWPGGEGHRIPAWATRVVQDPATLIFNAQVWSPDVPYVWKNTRPGGKAAAPFIYEAHVGMAGEELRMATYDEFRKNVFPRIAKAGYNTIQLMAIMEHPYYASFGYQVSSFFAPSSRFGTPDELKQLIDEAHKYGFRVIMDLVHSHAVKNEMEGLARFDGTHWQFFHDGARGTHAHWDSKCFNYGKPEVVHFLLSNCRYWLEEFRFDGFRFDGVTSMLYLDHGLRNFTHYDFYFDGNQDEDALTYLCLANRLIHEVHPGAITIAEDVSGMPGLASPLDQGGYGFDYRLAMGTPDYWIRIIKDKRDEEWDMGEMFYELTNRRKDEKVVGYAESHDQAIVGDQTIIFRLMERAMYTDMHGSSDTLAVERGIALHKMIRLITAATSGNGYLNFMGNEFGHPEWIDFPREGNGWSFSHARRQWSLADDADLKYRPLGLFDKHMLDFLKREEVLLHPHIEELWIHNEDKTLVFGRAGLIFAFNFNPDRSFPDYGFLVEHGKYSIILDSDQKKFGGQGRIDNSLVYASFATSEPHKGLLKIYLPARTAMVMKWLA